jgi:hypothetical protein
VNFRVNNQEKPKNKKKSTEMNESENSFFEKKFILKGSKGMGI